MTPTVEEIIARAICIRDVAMTLPHLYRGLLW